MLIDPLNDPFNIGKPGTSIILQYIIMTIFYPVRKRQKTSYLANIPSSRFRDADQLSIMLFTLCAKFESVMSIGRLTFNVVR